MLSVSATPKKHIENQYDAILKLQEKCQSCKSLQSKVAENILIYSVRESYTTEDGPAMLAIAHLGNDEYAIYAPDYLTDEQLIVFERLMNGANDTDKFVVFSKRSYDAMKKYSYGRPINVELHV